MPYMTRLLPDLQAAFPRVDVVKGWETRGSEDFAPAGVTCHWTAGPRGTLRRASLNIVTFGRPDLQWCLCNVYLDRMGIPVIVAAGKAWHAGPGYWRGASGASVTGNSGMYGIEAESGGDGDWTPEQRVAYPILVAAMLKGLKRDASWACGHDEWAPSRKIDIRDWPMSLMRKQVAAELNRQDEDDMPLSDIDVSRVADAVSARMRSSQWIDAYGKTATVERLLASSSHAGTVADGYGKRVQSVEAKLDALVAALGKVDAP